MNKLKLIPFIFLLMTACGGSGTNNPETTEYVEPPQRNRCYRTPEVEIEDFLSAVQADRKWYGDVDIHIPDNMPRDMVNAIQYSINIINDNLDDITLIITNNQNQANIVFHYSDIGRSYHGHAGNDIITINSNPEIRGNYINGQWACDRSRQALAAHELLHTLGFGHAPISFIYTIMNPGAPNCYTLTDGLLAYETVPTQRDLESLRYLYNDRMGYCN